MTPQNVKLHPAIHESRTEAARRRVARGDGRAYGMYWLVSAILVLYVGLVTVHRDNTWDTDAWEHQRVIRVLAESFDHPGNPTYDTAEPSIRYSPFSVGLALAVRWLGLSPYGALTAATVLNMVLFLFALWYVLRQLNAEAYALASLFALLLVYWRVPTYVGSMALADLPVGEASPSAFAVPLVMLVWGWVLWMRTSNAALWLLPATILVAAAAVLSHPMVGVFMAVCLSLAIFFSPRRDWGRIVGILALLAAGTLALCLAWPLYSFRDAITTKADDGWFFAASDIQHSLTSWTGLLFATALLAWPFIWRWRVARMCAVGWLLCFGMGLVSLPLKSALLARQTLLGAVFPAIAIGIFIHESGLIQFGTWRMRWKALQGAVPGGRAGAAAQLIVALVLVFSIPRELFTLARRVGPMIRHPEEQLQLRPRLEALLHDVGPRDVVFADTLTSWPVPAFAGRIVAAAHLEFFVPHQNLRGQDVNEFLKPDCTQARRDELLEKYHARWILLYATGKAEADAKGQGQNLAEMASLLEPGAVVKQDQNFFLMDARKWQALRKTAEKT